MAVIPVVPRTLKNVVAEFGDDDYRQHLDTVQFVPSASTTTWTGLGLNTFTDVSTATWTVTLSGAQDWSATGLSRFLFEHEGEEVDFTFRLSADDTVAFSSKVRITPGAVGGQVNSVAPFSVTLGCDKPTLATA